MQVPLEITFRDVDRSEAVEAVVRERVEKLERYFPRIISCRVTLDVPNRTPQYDVRNHRVSVEIGVPGEELAVSREPSEHDNFNDIYVTLRDAFDAAEGQLQAYAGRLNDSRKPHQELPPHAVVEKIFADDGYGFLMTSDGREIYFHKNSVAQRGFSRLHVGDAVRFVESRGDEGPQASLVESLGRDGSHLHPDDQALL